MQVHSSSEALRETSTRGRCVNLEPPSPKQILRFTSFEKRLPHRIHKEDFEGTVVINGHGTLLVRPSPTSRSGILPPTREYHGGKRWRSGKQCHLVSRNAGSYFATGSTLHNFEYPPNSPLKSFMLPMLRLSYSSSWRTHELCRDPSPPTSQYEKAWAGMISQ